MVNDWYGAGQPRAPATRTRPSCWTRRSWLGSSEQTVTCPVCGGTKVKFPSSAHRTPDSLPQGSRPADALDENEETGRIVVFAGFTGSVDRVVNLCLKEKWDVVRCDQGAFQVSRTTNDRGQADPLDYWADMGHRRWPFRNPESGGMSLTLVEARTAVYWSNSYKPEYRIQSEDRIHRIGMDLNMGCLIVDLIHLPSDNRVLDVIHENRRLELMTMGELMAGIRW